MTETIQNLIKTIEGNGLIVTLLSGGVIVTLFMHAKSIIETLWQWLLTLISFQVVNRFNCQYEEPEMLKKILFLLNEKSKILWMNQMELMMVNEQRNSNSVTAAPHGISYRLLYGKFVTVDKSFEAEGMKVTTIITMRIFFCFKKTFFKKFLYDLKNTVVKESKDNIVVDILGTWGMEKTKRSVESIYSSNDAPRKLIEDAKRFIKNEKLYEECEIPYKRNYLLYGKPGTGKSSSVLALASALDWNIVCIDINKNRLEDVIRTVVSRQKTIFLFEDVDAAAKNLAERKKKEKSEDNVAEIACYGEGDISLSQLLNITDGLITPHGSICVFTTNHIETLDEAFIRDGRMDQKIEFDYFKPETTKTMIKDRLGIKIANPKDNVCPATLQESILQVKLGNKTKEQFINEWSI